MDSTGKVTILVVDDDPFVRAMLLPVLTRHGYVALEARSGREGVELYSTFAGEIDLILTDITMPGMDGVRMVEQIRSGRSNARVLFISGRADTLPGWAGETCSLLLKPFRIPQLLGAIRACLEAKTPRAAQA